MPTIKPSLLAEIDCHLNALATCVQHLSPVTSEIENEGGQTIELLGNNKDVKVQHHCIKCKYVHETIWKISFFQDLIAKAQRAKGERDTSEVSCKAFLYTSSDRRSSKLSGSFRVRDENSASSHPRSGPLSPLDLLKRKQEILQRYATSPVHQQTQLDAEPDSLSTRSVNRVSCLDGTKRDADKDSVPTSKGDSMGALQAEKSAFNGYIRNLCSISSNCLEENNSQLNGTLTTPSRLHSLGNSIGSNFSTESEAGDTIQPQTLTMPSQTSSTMERSMNIKNQPEVPKTSKHFPELNTNAKPSAQPKGKPVLSAIREGPMSFKGSKGKHLRKKYRPSRAMKFKNWLKTTRNSFKKSGDSFGDSLKSFGKRSSITHRCSEGSAPDMSERRTSRRAAMMRKFQSFQMQNVQEQLDSLTPSVASQENSNTWLFRHDSALITIWDTLLFFALLYIIFHVPLRVGFNLAFRRKCLLCVGDCVIDAVFFLNIFMQLNTSYKDSITNEAVLDRKKTTRQYLRGSFLKDLICAFPFSILVFDRYRRGAWPLLGLIRLSKFKQLSQSNALMNQAGRRIGNPVIIRMAKIILLFVLATHYVSCAYWFITLSKGVFDEKRTWSPSSQLLDGPLVDRYAKALSISLGMLSGSSMGPLLVHEFWFECACFVLGFIINATIIASASTIVTDMDLQAVERKHQMDSIAQFMKSRGVPGQIQGRVQNYFNYLWDIGLSSYSQRIADELPPNLELEINLSLKKDLVEKCPLFKTCSFQAVIAIIQNLRPLVAQPKDVIVHAGEYADSMFFINKGSVSVTTPVDHAGVRNSSNGNIFLMKLSPGAFFGEVALVAKDSSRTATVTAETFVELQELNAEDFEVLLGTFPEFEKTVQYLVKNRLNLTQHMTHKTKTFAQLGLQSPHQCPTLPRRKSSLLLRKVRDKLRPVLEQTSTRHKKEPFYNENSFYDKVVDTKGSISYAMARDFKAGQGIVSRSITHRNL